ncbi:Heat shock factor (HSF)-type DNA-binding [Arabidopsis suecica]|uniref:Heat shock factor (HSF)-type DNA-binding n=1 Tax=Arabidopsis suecica TaxID=45249 RepID=A0A8T2EGV7_ARASU|nr:Heat shock factor (HSF)-type DNA-binding [Arabidopsis suecica]
MGQNFPNGLGTFYIGMYKLVEDPSSDPIISWSKSNNGFVMCNEEARIRSKILLRFNCGKLSEFLSELKYYGFTRVKKTDSGKMEFRNEDFVRGQPERLRDMMLKACRKHRAKFKAKEAAKEAAKELQRLQI